MKSKQAMQSERIACDACSACEYMNEPSELLQDCNCSLSTKLRVSRFSQLVAESARSIHIYVYKSSNVFVLIVYLLCLFGTWLDGWMDGWMDG